MSPTQKTILKALIVGIVLSAPTLLAESGIGPAHLPKTRKQAATDRPTAAALKQAFAKQKQGFPGAQKVTPTAPAPGNDIYANSIILHHEGTHTVIPRHAVIFTPDSLQGKITRKAEGKYLPWPEFYTANRNWLFTHHVTLKQAEGKEPIQANVKTQFARINRIVVSLFQNYPISTLPKP